MSNRIDLAIQEATEAVDKVMQPLKPKPEPKWTREDRAAAARMLEQAIEQVKGASHEL